MNRTIILLPLLFFHLAAGQPKTKLDALYEAPGLLTERIEFVGNVPGSDDGVLAVKAIELAHSPSKRTAKGLLVVILGSNSSRTTGSTVDLDEVDGLLGGIKQMRNAITKGTRNTRIVYSTKGGFSILLEIEGSSLYLSCIGSGSRVSFSYSNQALDVIEEHIEAAKKALK